MAWNNRKITIIAEIGQNHNGDMEIARKLIWAAKASGVDAAKFQVFDADRTFGKEGNEWYDYNCKTQLSREQVRFLKEECEKAGIEFFASVFDSERVHWLEELGVERYKVASRSIHDLELLAALADTGKPLIVSLGFWEKPEFPVISTTAPVDFLYCISKYPTPFTDLHFQDVDFSRYAGFSDHTVGIVASCIALARGARILEKHFTLDKKMYGPDHGVSATPEELRQISEFRNELRQCL